MKLRNLIIASMAFFAFAACEDGPAGVSLPVSVQPFSDVSFSVGEETAEGYVEGNSIIVAFNNADAVSNVKVDVKVKPGFTLTYPANPDAADFSKTPVLIFENSRGAEFKYFITFTSNAFPLYDIQKVAVDGLEAGEQLTLDNTERKLIVAFTKAMEAENITLSFGKGSLVAGFVPQDDLSFDFTTSLEQTITFTKAVEGSDPLQVEYQLVLDMSAVVLQYPADMGFQDITATYVDPAAYPYIKVYRTERVPAVPVDIMGPAEVANSNGDIITSQVLKDSYGGWHKDTPNMWGFNNVWVWSKLYDIEDDAFSLYGDWEEERRTIEEIVPIVMVVIDAKAVKGGIEANAESGVDITALDNLISVTGTPKFDALHILDNGEYVINQKSANSTPGEVYADNDISYRAAVGFDAEGKMSFATMYTENNVIQQIDFIKAGGDITGTVAAAYDWNIVEAATNFPYLYRNGYAVKKMDQVLNDGSTYSDWVPAHNYDDPADALGHGTRGYGNSRAIIGRTWDGKITIAVCPIGWEEGATADPASPYYGRYYQPHGYSLNQLTYLMVKLGWRDVFPLGSGAEWSVDGSSQAYRANIKINGQLVLSEDDYTTTSGNKTTVHGNVSPIAPSYCVTFDPKTAN